MNRAALVACGVFSSALLVGCGGSAGPSSASPVGSEADRSGSGAATATAAPASTPSASAGRPERDKRAEPNTLDGVYTAKQALRGRGVFEAVCSECHEPSDWTDSSFLARWNEDSVFRFWYYVFERMPHGAPMTLSREQVTDAVAYIFELNGLPTGPTELGTDDDDLDDHWIIWGR